MYMCSALTAIGLPRQVRLEDVVHSDKKLWLVFEYVDLDLKKHMDTNPGFGSDHSIIKVPPLVACLCSFCRQGICTAARRLHDRLL